MTNTSLTPLLERMGVREPAPPVFPVFRSRITSAVLARAYLGGDECSVAELAAAAGTDTGTMAREVARLEQAAVLRSRRIGRTRLVEANRNAPFYRALSELVTITLGPAHVLSEELAEVAGIEQAEVFGSWAARMLGEPGPAPVDIDLLVIGRPDRDDLHDAATRAGARLGREVNTVVVSASRWRTSDDGFLTELRSRPRVPVPLRGEDAP
ncbi:hypothetical protein [Planomonospora algeriensis]